MRGCQCDLLLVQLLRESRGDGSVLEWLRCRREVHYWRLLLHFHIGHGIVHRRLLMRLRQRCRIEGRRLVSELMRRKGRRMRLLRLLLWLKAKGIMTLKVVVQSLGIEAMEMGERRGLASMHAAF